MDVLRTLHITHRYIWNAEVIGRQIDSVKTCHNSPHARKVDTSWYVRLRSPLRTQILPGGTERKWICPPPTSQLNLVSFVAISANNQEPLIYLLSCDCRYIDRDFRAMGQF